MEEMNIFEAPSADTRLREQAASARSIYPDSFWLDLMGLSEGSLKSSDPLRDPVGETLSGWSRANVRAELYRIHAIYQERPGEPMLVVDGVKLRQHEYDLATELGIRLVEGA